MRKVTLFLIFLGLAMPAFSSLSDFQTQEIQRNFNNLSIQDLQKAITHLNLEARLYSSSQKREILSLAKSILKLKIEGLYKDDSINDLQKIASEEEKTYRTLEIAKTLEKIMNREVFLNEEGAFVLSNKTPVVYQKQSNNFCLRPYRNPPVNPNLHKGNVISVFEESLKHPNYSLLHWNSDREEYTLYSVEYDRIFGEKDLENLNDDQIIIIFGKLFPISLKKPAWAWKIFGLTSIKREIKDLFVRENLARLNYLNS